jgi:cell wall-associated NlpC family hydrolase
MNTNNYIRIPFLDCGRTIKGADCWGLVRIIYLQELNIELPLMNEYDDCQDKLVIPSLLENKPNVWTPVKSGDEKAFDVPVFKMGGYPMHVGLVVNKGLMIHCERGSGTTLVRYNKEHQWFRRLIGFYRYAQCSDITTSIQPSA